jgi:hypothetical protein
LGFKGVMRALLDRSAAVDAASATGTAGRAVLQAGEQAQPAPSHRAAREL